MKLSLNSTDYIERPVKAWNRRAAVHWTSSQTCPAQLANIVLLLSEQKIEHQCHSEGFICEESFLHGWHSFWVNINRSLQVLPRQRCRWTRLRYDRNDESVQWTNCIVREFLLVHLIRDGLQRPQTLQLQCRMTAPLMKDSRRVGTAHLLISHQGWNCQIVSQNS